MSRQQAGASGDFFRKKKSGAFYSPLKKLCLFIRHKELRILARRLRTFAEEELESCHRWLSKGNRAQGGSRQMEEPCAPAPCSRRLGLWRWFRRLASAVDPRQPGRPVARRPNLILGQLWPQKALMRLSQERVSVP